MHNGNGSIVLHSIYKSFGTLTAVQAVSFSVEPGEIFGLLGPNGAGKTTLLRLIMDIIRPDDGIIEVFGGKLGEEDKDRIGYLPEERGLYTRQKVLGVLKYLVQLKGLTEDQARTNILHWLARMEMSDVWDRKIQELSKGNQQKIQFIATVASDPDILVLDEPFSGLDPVNTRGMLETIRELAEAGKTIVLSTHQMSLVESLCRRIFMIHSGRQVLYGSLEDVQRSHSDSSFVVRSDADYSRCSFILKTSPDGRGTRICLTPGATGRDLLSWLLESGAQVDAFEKAVTPLEDIFIKLAKNS
jgi:ABC-2 type transport system ATP-binding protein